MRQGKKGNLVDIAKGKAIKQQRQAFSNKKKWTQNNGQNQWNEEI